MTDKIEFLEIETSFGVQSSVLITREDGSMLSMPKLVWDEQQAQKALGGTL